MASPGVGSHEAPKGGGVVQPSSSSSTGKGSSSLISNNETMKPKILTTQELHKITHNLSELIGEGAFGQVYKGVLDDGEEVAVKVLNTKSQATKDKEFEDEFNNLIMLNHPNIVRLVGYCFEIKNQYMEYKGRGVFAGNTSRALCFEFMHKGSLEKYISDELHGLNWKTRYKIIKGVCEGLKYLHGLKTPIFHLDLKPENILLDENMTPKLADFGLSKLCDASQTLTVENLAGTIEYMAPEYLRYRKLSNKVDVFSMGVVITKIIAGPDGPKRIAETSNQEFHDQVYENWKKRLEATCTSSRILDAYCEQVSICTEIGLNSMETERGKRPSILHIIDRLDETETMIEKASAISRSPFPVKPKREKDDDLVKVEAFTRNKAIHVTETCDEFPVLVRVTAARSHRAEEMLRNDVDIVLVLNLRMNTVKEAVMVLVDSLSPIDRLSILFHAQDKLRVMDLTYMSEHGRDVARWKINKLAQSHAHGEALYIGAVLREAAEILLQRGVEESSRRPGHILYMWTGSTPGQDICQEFPVHIIAIVKHGRYPEMKRIADMTSGTYDEYEMSDLIEPKNVFASFFARTQWVARRPFRMTLQPNEGVTISSIESGHYHNLVSSDKQSATVDLHGMYAGEQKTFVVYLTVPQGKEKLVTIRGGYQSQNTRKELVGMDVVVLRPRRKCLPDEVVIHPKVAAKLLRIRLMEDISKGNQDLSRNNLRLLLDDIKNSDDAPEEIMSALEEEIAEITDRCGFARESMLWSLNCHQLQLSTTKGALHNIDAFQILEQQREDELANLVKVKGFTKCKAIKHSETCNEFPVLVRVTAAPWQNSWDMPRVGVDIVAVLDISTNMQGERLELVKQAMMIVVDKLGPEDRLSIMSLQAHKHCHMELVYLSDDHDHGRDAARFKITQLKASTGMYMSTIANAVLEEGAQILRDRAAEERATRLGCLMLLSDGKYPEILQENISPGFPVHTFGLGAEHNPKVMKYIADMTSGTYSFVDQDISNIKNAIALFITGLTSIVATSITITLRAHCDIAISSIESGNYIHHVKSDKMSGKIIIDSIYAGDQKEFIVKLIVGNARKELMTISGEYKSFTRNKSTAKVEMSVLRPWFKSSPDDLAIHPDVAAELTRIRLQDGILDMLNAEKMNTQGLQNLWNKIKHSDESRGAPEETLSRLGTEVAEMSRDIPGMPYTLSWLSCHKCQRATTKGTPRKSSTFQTIGQYSEDDTNLVKVETFTRSKAIPSDDPCNKFPVLVRVTVAPRQHAEEMRRACVDVVAVLDANAGMQGVKLEHMKEGMMAVIDKLNAKDRLSIVSLNTYESRLTKLTYMTDHGRDVARQRISKLVAGGHGDIVPALREGVEILSWREAESSRRVGCIMFLSDCNYQISETEIISEFPVHTFGLGTDHNPSMMKYIADITSGTYSFVNQDISMIKDALTLFITGITSVAAMSIKITLRTNEGITMSSIESGGYINHVQNNQFGTIDIDNIYAGERKDFIAYLRVAEGKKELMTIGGRYLSHDTVKHLVYKDVDVQRPHQECLPGDLAIQPDMAAELVRIRLEKGISTMLENGTSTAGLQQLWEEIMDTDEGRGASEDTISGLSMDVAEMKRGIENPKEYRKSGLPYTLSWLTSRKWQRATTKGTPCSSGAIETTVHDADGRATLPEDFHNNFYSAQYSKGDFLI